jgi:TRAP-type C4-dicarboxylate transport system substrate-binding protein
MIIDGQIVMSQQMWDDLADDVKAAIKKGGVTVMSNTEWEKLGELMKAEAARIIAERKNDGL